MLDLRGALRREATLQNLPDTPGVRDLFALAHFLHRRFPLPLVLVDPFGVIQQTALLKEGVRVHSEECF